MVSAYELEVLGRDCWCYSATNPNYNRFDVARVAPDLSSSSVKLRGKPTPAHSWFSGLAWCMVYPPPPC